MNVTWVHATALALATALLAACTSTPSAAALRVVRATGGRQCEGGGLAVDAMRRQLEAAGVRVLNAQCATDGRMRPAMCGAPDGRLGVFEIAAAGQAAAAAQGFQPLAEDAGVRVVPCP